MTQVKLYTDLTCSVTLGRVLLILLDLLIILTVCICFSLAVILDNFRIETRFKKTNDGSNYLKEVC